MIEITIIDNDNVRAFGLKHLVEKYFNLNVTIFCDPNTTSSPTEYNPNTLYIITPDKFLSYLDFFITKRQRTIILSQQKHQNEYCTINPSDDISSIIEKLNEAITSHQEVTTSNASQNLSAREIDVLKLVAMGYINKEIADKLSISINTVLTHRKNITSKLGIRSVSGLSVYAIMNGLISDNNVI